jgi:5-methylcytosine-specific restriction endonuclease McrA
VTGSSFTHAKRGSMTPQRALRIFQAADGRCHICKRKLGPADDWEVEHVIALENGGTDDDANLAPACSWCHADKTTDDHAQAGHGRRMAVRAFVPKRYRQKRGFR